MEQTSEDKGKPAVSRAPKTIEVNESTVDFIKHIAPYYEPCMLFVVTHMFYYFGKGNLMWVMLIAYGINFPYFKWTAKTPQLEYNYDR